MRVGADKGHRLGRYRSDTEVAAVIASKATLGDSGCLEYRGNRNAMGYGVMWFKGRRGTLVHRVAWTLAHGPIPGGMNVLHHCDNPPCIKTEGDGQWPEGHLFLGSRDDNMADMKAKGRRSRWLDDTHCSHGHESDRVSGRCRECVRLHNRKRTIRKWAARGVTIQ